MLLTRIMGWPTFTGTDPEAEPHMPWAMVIFRPTRSMRVSTSPPLPIREAPRTGRTIFQSSTQ